MRLSKEILGQIEGKMPQLDSEQPLVFAEWEASGEDIEGINLIEVDKNSGKPLKIWGYQVADYEDFRGEEGSWIPKGYLLSEVTKIKYNPFVYSHPILNRQIDAEMQEMRNWGTDKAGRRIERLAAVRLVIVFDDFWDAKSERPRSFQVLEERVFEAREPEERISVGTKTKWIEKYRSFLFSNATIVYVRNLDGRMVHSYFKSLLKYSGVDFPIGMKPPTEMGEATFIDF